MTRAGQTKTVAYVRVSTDKQAERGISLEAQEAKLRAYAALYDLELVAVEVDAGESAASLERPALKRALAMLRSGRAGALLVVKLDRLTRSVRDLAELVDRYFASGKRALLSVSEQIDTRTAAGRGVLNILGSVSQMERELIGERTSAAMAHLRASGRRSSGIAPYGHAHGPAGELVDVPAEQAVVARARELRAAGASLRAVAGALEEAGLVSRAGRAFTPSAIAAMCVAADTAAA